MKVSEAMSRDVQIASPEQTIQAAAQLMTDIDAGVLPVGENDRLVGMLTDRDIAVRAVARGRDPQTTVREVMTARSEEHTAELQSLRRISYAVFCLKKKKKTQ